MEQVESCVPPGFRFHPTEEELVGFYLYRKVNSLKFDLDVIIDIDLYRMEPWEIQDKCKLGYDEQTEWYFFSHKDRKYPTGTRTNRATATGFWKATGRDKAVLYKNKIIGMRKTLVFYKGRAPNGKKSDWIVHEYRLQTTEHAPPQEEGWVVCRAFKKPTPSYNQGPYGAWNAHHNNIYNNYNSMMIGSPSVPDISSPTNLSSGTFQYSHQTNMQPLSCNFEQELNSTTFINDLIENQATIELPRLESPSLSSSFQSGRMMNNEDRYHDHKGHNNMDNQWEILDNLLSCSNSSSSFCNNEAPNLQLVPHDHYGLDVDHNQLGSSTFLGCFPNNL